MSLKEKRLCRKVGTHFDKLPDEVIEHLCRFLSSKDICSLAKSSKRVEEAVQDNSKLSLHLMEGLDLIIEASKSDEIRRRVASSFQLKKKIDFKLIFFRNVADIPFEQFNDITASYFHFYSGTAQHKIQLLLDLANKVPNPGYYVGKQLRIWHWKTVTKVNTSPTAQFQFLVKVED